MPKKETTTRTKEDPLRIYEMLNTVECIVHYYTTYKKYEGDDDPSEAWKKVLNTNLPHPVPEEIDKEVKEAFIKALKKYN